MTIINRFLLLLILLFGSFWLGAQNGSKLNLILDADTGNEVDDYFALARALAEPEWKITALNATQWEASQWSIPETMENSHRLNQVILAEMDKNVKTRRGGVNRMFDWGDMAQHSAAAYEIIHQAQDLAQGEKLIIVALGALTNVASAIYIEPSISAKIRLYWLGSTYDFDKGILKRQDFNCMMDQQAVEVLLMSDAEMHIMPVNVAIQMQFTFEETESQLPESSLSKLLMDRWYTHLDGGRKQRVLWDLALIQSIIHPEWTHVTTITTSKDQGSRQIHFYDSIDVKNMKGEFFKVMKGMGQ